MAELTEIVQNSAPEVADLDIGATRKRAAEIRDRDRRRSRLVYGGVAGVVLLLVGTVLTGNWDQRTETRLDASVATAPADVPTATAPPVPAGTDPMVVPPPTNSTEMFGSLPTDADGYRIWDLQPGDTLSSIAEAVYGDPLAFGVIAEANGLTGSSPSLGSQLIIPPPPSNDEVGASAFPSPAATGTPMPEVADERLYEVQPGDSLGEIANAAYGDPLAFVQIAEENDLTDSSPLQVGQVLVIPPYVQPAPVDPVDETRVELLPTAMDADLLDAIDAGAPVPWQSVPSNQGVAFRRGVTTLTFVHVALPVGVSPAQAVTSEIENGAATMELGDGAVASVTGVGPGAEGPFQGPILVPLPNERLLRLTADPATTVDDLFVDLERWLVAIRMSLDMP